MISPAFAHGASPGGAVGGAGPLVLVAGIIAFVLFLVFVRRKKGWSVLVTGGAGYVGSALVPKLLDNGHRVTVLDLYLFGDDALALARGHVNLREVRGDIRDAKTVAAALEGCDAVIHLAAVSDARSYDLDPGLARSVNLDAVTALVRAARNSGIKRFVLASDAAVYGAGDGEAVEDEPPAPADGFATDKARAEEILLGARAPGFVAAAVRPANICGPAPCQRVDSGVNAMTRAAVEEGRVAVAGADAPCPVLHVDDMADLYLFILGQPDGRIDGRVFNAVAGNPTLGAVAETVCRVVGGDVAVEALAGPSPGDGAPARPLSADAMTRDLGFRPRRTLTDAVGALADALRARPVPVAPDRPRYAGVPWRERAQ